MAYLKGNHFEIGRAYAGLLANETSETYHTFLNDVFTATEQLELITFLDFCWSQFLIKHTPQEYLDELKGMASVSVAEGITPPQTVSQFFYTVANMPADPQNIVSMLEEELEPASWPWWLKDGIDEIIRNLLKLPWGCDAYGVWGDRTVDGRLYSSRNLDWKSNTGIDKHKLITIINEDSSHAHAAIGYAVGLGALAGMSSKGITVSEMNLDNNEVTFNGLAFPLRLRMIMGKSENLQQAMTLWNATNNTNRYTSFLFCCFFPNCLNSLSFSSFSLSLVASTFSLDLPAMQLMVDLELLPWKRSRDSLKSTQTILMLKEMLSFCASMTRARNGQIRQVW